MSDTIMLHDVVKMSVWIKDDKMGADGDEYQTMRITITRLDGREDLITLFTPLPSYLEGGESKFELELAKSTFKIANVIDDPET